MFKKLKTDKKAESPIKLVLGLVILDLIAFALVPTIANSASDAKDGLTNNTSAQGMVDITVVLYVIVILVANAAVVIYMVGGKK